MTQTTPERAPCGTCGNEYTVTANRTIRHHLTDNPEFQAGPDSRKCKGVGQPPAGPAGVALAEDRAAQHQCRLCRHPVVLTGNGRARSHLTPEQTARPCPGGSDFPLGRYPDIVGTTDGLVATLAFDCEHRETGACYDCAAARSEAPGDIGHAQPDGRADHMHIPGEDPYGATACVVCGLVLIERQTMADEFEATPLTEALVRETAGVGTVLDAMDGDTRAEAERFMAASVPEQPTARVEHKYTDETGVEWVHPGPEDACQAVDCRLLRGAGTAVPLMDPYGRIKGGGVYCEKCDTDTHRCPGCGEAVPHGTAACGDCTARVAVADAERQAQCTHPDGFNAPLLIDGRDVPACGHCDAVQWFTGPDPELPNCPHPETHRAGCGCPDDGSQDPADAWRTPADLLAKMPEDVRGVDALRLNCAACGHPVTPLVDYFGPDGRAAAVTWACEPRVMSMSPGDPCRDHECLPDKRACLGDLEVGDHFVRHGTVMRVAAMPVGGSVHAVVVDGPMKGREGDLKDWGEIVERAVLPRDDSRVWVADLEEGDHFIRRGTLMRATSSGYGLVEAVVVDGPHKGRKGELADPSEMVEKTAAPQTTEQETTECTDDRTPQQRPGSSAGSTRTTISPTTAPAPGSPRATRASVPAVSPKSGSVTSSAPTARAAGSDRSAAVTTDAQQADAAAAFLGTGGRPATAGPAVQADAAAQFLAGAGGTHGEKETKRDRYGRYLIPHPDTGKEQAWTRATTFAKSISDTYALSQWGLRMALLGATMRPDIVRRAHGKHVRADKQLLDELTAELKDAAGAKVAANDGTAMHSFTEMADRAWHSPGGPRSVLDQVPPDCRENVETYIRMLEETGLEPVPHLIEFTTVVKQYGVAGTSDNCYKVTRPLVLKIGRTEVLFTPGEYVIGDKKTGRDLDYGWQEIAIQLGVYAQGINTAGVWVREDEVWEPDPLSRFDEPGTKVRTDAGIVVHLPVDKESKKTPTVYGIDLESGWNAAVLCERVREWRKFRNLAAPVTVSEADTTAPKRPAPEVTTRTTVRPASLRDRAEAVTSNSEASAVWQAAKAAGRPKAELDELTALMRDRLQKLAEPAG